MFSAEDYQTVTSLTETLISFRSYEQEQANAALKFASNWLKRRGITSEMFSCGDSLSMIAGQCFGHSFAFNGHLDVVPGAARQFVPQRRGDDRLEGRGSYDMIGAVAAAMVTSARLVADGKTPPLLALVTTEETNGDLGTGYLIEQGHNPAFVVCGEPTDFKVVNEAKGVLRLEVATEGISAHASRPWQGQNAIEGALSFYKRLLKLPFFETSSDQLGRASVNLAWIQGGGRFNQVPDQCISRYEIRFLPGQDPVKLINVLKDEFPDSTVTMIKQINSVSVDPHHKYIEALKTSIQRNGVKPSICSHHGTSDIRFYAAKGIPAVEFGPEGGGHHGPEEWVSINSLIKYAQILYNFFDENGSN